MSKQLTTIFNFIKAWIRPPKASRAKMFLNEKGKCVRIFERKDGTYGIRTSGHIENGALAPASTDNGVSYPSMEIAERELRTDGEWRPIGLDAKAHRRIQLWMFPLTVLAAALAMLVIPWMLGFALILHLRSRYWYGSRGFKYPAVTDEPVRALVLLTVGPKPGPCDEHLDFFRTSQSRAVKTGLKGSHPWTRSARRKLKAAVIQLEKDGVLLTVNSDTLCAYFFGTEENYSKAKQVFEELHRDPDFADTRIGEARIEPSPRVMTSNALLKAIEGALKQPS